MIPCRHKFMRWFDFCLIFFFSRCTQALAFPAMICASVGDLQRTLFIYTLLRVAVIFLSVQGRSIRL